MGVGYYLVNNCKREQLSFGDISGNKKRELAGNPASAAITTWYLLEHIGDEIAFVSDTYDDWPFRTGSRKDWCGYNDVTDHIIDQLIQSGILQDDGKEFLTTTLMCICADYETNGWMM